MRNRRWVLLLMALTAGAAHAGQAPSPPAERGAGPAAGAADADDAARQREELRRAAEQKNEERKRRGPRSGGIELVYRSRMNLSFENAAEPIGWRIADEGYRARVVTTKGEAPEGNRYLELERSGAGRFGTATGNFPVIDALGKTLRLTGTLRTAAVADGYAGLWLRVDGADGLIGFAGMEDRGVAGTTGWAKYSVEVGIPPAATNVSFGVILTGSGVVAADHLNFEVLDPSPGLPRPVAGAVRDVRGRGVPGAYVGFFHDDEIEPAASVRSGGDGRFSSLLAPGRYAATATSDGAAGYLPSLEVGAEGGLAGLGIELTPAGLTISGRVLAEAEPVPGARICAVRASDERGDIFCTESDEDGRYRLPLPAGTYFALTVGGSGLWQTVDARREVSTDASIDFEALTLARLTRPAPPGVLSWMKGAALALPGPDSEGFIEAARLAAGARVVGLGGPTPGTHELTALKAELFRALVTEGGIRVLAIEADSAAAAAVNGYLATGLGDLPTLLAALDVWHYETPEFEALIEWMRSYNVAQEHAPNLGVLGLGGPGPTPDATLADELGALLEAAPARRIVLWADNDRVGRSARVDGSGRLGPILAERFGGGYVAFAGTFAAGSFVALDRERPGAPAGGLSVRTAATPAAGSLEAALAQVGTGAFALDLRARPGGVVAEWLAAPHLARADAARGGGGPGGMVVMTPGLEFDLLYFAAEVTPARPGASRAASPRPPAAP